MRTDLYLTKYIIYIYTCKNDLNQFENDGIHENDWGQRDIMNKYNIN